MALKTDYKDDVFSGSRKYIQTINEDGTVSLSDATQYEQQGDYFGANELNEIGKTVNNVASFEMAGGAATAITLTGIALENGCSKTFIVAANNNGAATTINGKPLYKPGGTAAPKLVAGKAVTVWYNGTNFFIKASAEGDAVAADVLAGKEYSNDDDTGLVGTMPNNGAVNQSLPINGTYNIPAGYHNGSGKVTQSITSKSAATYTPGTSDQTIAAGQYLSGAQTIKATTGTATAGDVLSGKTFNSANGIGLTGNMTNQSAKVITPGTTNQAIAAGYHNGSGYVVGDPDLIPANILNTANIFGVQGAAQAGKRWATGTKVSINYAEPFEGISGSAHTTSTLEITGLTFKPSTIVISAFTGTLYLLTTYWGINIATVTSFRNNNVNIDRYYCLKILNDAYGYVSAAGFKMPVAYGNITYTWVAYE